MKGWQESSDVGERKKKKVCRAFQKSGFRCTGPL